MMQFCWHTTNALHILFDFNWPRSMFTFVSKVFDQLSMSVGNLYIYTFRCVQFAKKKFARCSSKWSICVVFFFLVLLPIGYDDYSCQSLEFEKIPIVISSFQAISILIDFKSVANEHFSPFQISLIVCFNEMRDTIYL